MYQGKSSRPKQEKQKPTPRWILFVRDVFAGKHLLKTWKRWAPWALIIFVDMLLIVANERSINKKESEVKNAADTQKTLMRKLKQTNETVYSEKQEDLNQRAEELGFEPIKEYQYYHIEE